jgi:chromosome segregation ATPase
MSLVSVTQLVNAANFLLNRTKTLTVERDNLQSTNTGLANQVAQVSQQLAVALSNDAADAATIAAAQQAAADAQAQAAQSAQALSDLQSENANAEQMLNDALAALAAAGVDVNATSSTP